MAVKPVAKDLSVVAAGALNPAILHPSWFAAQGLIKRSEADESSVEVVHKEVAIWEIDWLKVNATNARIQLLTEKEPYFGPARDLLLGMFNFLAHTPLTALGINRSGYYQFPNNEAYQDFGHKILPKDRWIALKNPTTNRITTRSERSDGLKGHVGVTLTGHSRFPFCVYVTINEHFDLDKESDVSPVQQISKIFDTAWKTSEEQAESLAAGLFEGY